MEKIYRVQMNSKGMPNFSTAVEVADRPQGEWIYCEEDDSHLPEDGRYGIFKCSNCGSKQSFPISEGSGRVYGDNYCPSCGARMKGADDEISCR